MLSQSTIEIDGGAEMVRVREEDWRHLHRKLKSYAKQRVVLEAAEALLLVEAEESRLYRRLGYPSMHGYMENELHYGRHAANERLRVAYALMDLPQLAEAFRAGDQPFAAVRELTRCVTAETEEAWLAAIDGKGSTEVQQLVKGRRKGDLPEDRPDPALMTEYIRLEVSAATAAEWRKMRAAIDDERGEHASDDEIAQTIIRRTLDPAPAADQPTRPTYQIAVTTCRVCKRGHQVAAGTEVELLPAALERATCDAEHIGDLEHEGPSRLRSTIPGPTRRKVFLRDRYACTFPGCTSKRYLEAHHVRHREHGGGHQLWNLTLLCDGHHKLHHDGVVTIRGRAPDQLVFESPAAADADDDPGPGRD